MVSMVTHSAAHKCMYLSTAIVGMETAGDHVIYMYMYIYMIVIIIIALILIKSACTLSIMDA